MMKIISAKFLFFLFMATGILVILIHLATWLHPATISNDFATLSIFAFVLSGIILSLKNNEKSI